MYLSTDAIIGAIAALKETVHPFIGITYLACKNYGLPVGSLDEVRLDTLTREHMDKFHRLDRRSSYYFQPFKGGRGSWVTSRYPSTGLQTINTQTFISAFIHPRKEPRWGFQEGYLGIIKRLLSERGFTSTVPADALAVWLYKDQELDVTTIDGLVLRFFDEFNIDEYEATDLFAKRAFRTGFVEKAFVDVPLEMTALLEALPEPPDASAEGGRTISSLSLSNVGPVDSISIDFGSRLSIVTGDNGLGKSFLLDFAWWAATGKWAGLEALPKVQEGKALTSVLYSLTGASGRTTTFLSLYDQRTATWTRPADAMTVEGLAVFSKADGSFAVSDPVRDRLFRNSPSAGNLSASDVWNGKSSVIEGLIRDWITWQRAADSKTFDRFSAVLRRLSPEDLGLLSPGDPIRLPGDVREIPTITHRYGTIPVTHASSGVKRVLLLSYLMIWSWREHELASEQIGERPLRRILVVVDELEAHLHPKWQRIVLPALLGVGDILSSDLAVQMLSATHSPMILASAESIFDESSDRLYHLYTSGSKVSLEAVPFVKYGDISGWLTSPLFGLQHARSRDAENAIELAKALQLEESPETQEVARVSDLLRRFLASDDRFWPRWLFFAEQHGVEL